ncbi:MAG: hypothetical protein ACR2KX_08175 [Chitinophagaceae bacterium]
MKSTLKQFTGLWLLLPGILLIAKYSLAPSRQSFIFVLDKSPPLW